MSGLVTGGLGASDTLLTGGLGYSLDVAPGAPAGMLVWFPVKLASYTRPYGSYVNGIWIPAYSAPKPCWIVEFQPDNGHVGQYPEEGNRVYSHFKTWTSVRMAVNDIITDAGTDYIVVRVGPWHEQAGFGKIFIREVQS